MRPTGTSEYLLGNLQTAYPFVPHTGETDSPIRGVVADFSVSSSADGLFACPQVSVRMSQISGSVTLTVYLNNVAVFGPGVSGSVLSSSVWSSSMADRPGWLVSRFYRQDGDEVVLAGSIVSQNVDLPEETAILAPGRWRPIISGVRGFRVRAAGELGERMTGDVSLETSRNLVLSPGGGHNLVLAGLAGAGPNGGAPECSDPGLDVLVRALSGVRPDSLGNVNMSPGNRGSIFVLPRVGSASVLVDAEGRQAVTPVELAKHYDRLAFVVAMYNSIHEAVLLAKSDMAAAASRLQTAISRIEV